MMPDFADLFESWAAEPLLRCDELGANGSNRRYFRLRGRSHGCIAAFNDDVRENDAFVYYSRQFRAKGLPVPELYAVSADRRRYLQQDLGDTTLYSFWREKKRQGGGFDAEMLSLYKQALSDLAQFQIRGRDLDFSMAYPRSDFDTQSLSWDFQYFKYYYLKLAHIPFDEQLLEDDFQSLIRFLLEGDCSYFLYRDFQTRNIMVVDGEDGQKKLYYIDYQGGRRGAPEYDVASLLYSSKSEMPEVVRQELLGHYFKEFGQVASALAIGRPMTESKFYAYVLARLMQAMGAYGYRGYFERKSSFLESIPVAINNLRCLIESHPLALDVPHLKQVLRSVVDTAPVGLAVPAAQSGSDCLTVTVCSFSYKKGLPDDKSGNGGGFLFDCRALPNPGRYPEFQAYTGRDANVVAFLAKEPAVGSFLDNAQHLVFQSVDKYLERRFSHLFVGFGCTGGQHRSVYCAEAMARHIRSQYPQCQVVVFHREQQR